MRATRAGRSWQMVSFGSGGYSWRQRFAITHATFRVNEIWTSSQANLTSGWTAPSSITRSRSSGPSAANKMNRKIVNIWVINSSHNRKYQWCCREPRLPPLALPDAESEANEQCVGLRRLLRLRASASKCLKRCLLVPTKTRIGAVARHFVSDNRRE